MDNAHYHTERFDGSPKEEKGRAIEARLVVSLERLIKNRDWKVIAEDMLAPRLKGAREKADTMEGPELFRFQGEIRVLKFLLNLETALTAQQQTIETQHDETKTAEAGE